MKVTVNFVISPKGEVAVDVIGAKGPVCMTEILEEMEALLGPSTDTKFKPEYELDLEVVEILRDQEIKL
jgi:hypothetical protein